MYYVIYGALHNISTQIIALHKDAGRELILETSSDTDSQSWARQASKARPDWERTFRCFNEAGQSWLVFFGVIGVGFGEIGLGVLHELCLGLLIAEAIGLALDRGIDGAVRLDILVERKAHCTEIVVLAFGGCHSRYGQTKH